ncbi:MAG TPA: hydroxysqualene dehydroxylase HpnE [Casimicrobiaceae bacterium]|nr:hydroxysqualene dehydroxylase HpnE [Casimicrobiaceae bacterium]
MIEAASARVAVIGAGWAGCAAAVHLARAGVQVSLYEQARQPGGRARTVSVDGIALDNGQHLLIGAYRATLDLLGIVQDGRTHALFTDLPLTLRPFGAGKGVTFVARSLPAPWHFLGALLTARGLTLRERAALARVMQDVARDDPQAHDEPMRQRFASVPRAVYHGILEPLCLAALNTPPERASARIFGNALRAALGGPEPASRFLLPRAGLGALLPEPAIAFVARHRGEVHLGQRVRALRIDQDLVRVVTTRRIDGFDAVVVAVAPHQVAHLDVESTQNAWAAVRRSASALRHESITTVHLGYTRGAMPAPLARLDDAPGQWVFDGGEREIADERLRLLAVVISASGAHDAWPQQELVRAVDAQLRRLSPALGALRFSRVFAERRATYACTPDLARPRAGRISPRLHLAGDYTHDAYPATLEAAVQSGETAANSVLAEIQTRRTPRLALPA